MLPRRRDIRIVYEDRWIVVIDKPSGLLTMSTGKSGEDTAYSRLTAIMGSKIFIVHRLDRDTSGLLVFAKDAMTKHLLQENWDESVLERRYVALVRGIPNPAEDTITSWLRESPKSFKVHSSARDDGGQKAVTHYRLLKGGRAYSLVEFELETGRKNQIRVHSSLMGNPIAGDTKYWDLGGNRERPGNPIGRLALHAKSLVFIHPQTGKKMSFQSPVPGNFIALDEEPKGRSRH